MRGGHVDAVSRLQVSGWAADSDDPDRALELIILVNGVDAGRSLADRRRKDVAALGKFGQSGHGFAFAFPDPLRADTDQNVTVHYADDMRLLPNGERLLPRDPDAPAPAEAFGAIHGAGDAPLSRPAGPDPILVTAPGRSGTTYLMGCLAASPDIVVAELVPYEVRQLSYYAGVFSVLTAPPDAARAADPDHLEGDGVQIGSNPFNAPQYDHAFRSRAALAYLQESLLPARLGAAFADLAREYYRRLALDHGKGAAAFFAEKNNNLHRPTRMFVRRAFPRMREIAIVRDPRDVLCSHMAYFASSQEKAFRQLSGSCRELAAMQETATDDLHFLRYEDMLRGDASTFAKLSDFLGAQVQPARGDLGDAVFRKHGTSDTPEASVGRWRRELPADMIDQSSREWGSFLDRFGYDRT